MKIDKERFTIAAALVVILLVVGGISATFYSQEKALREASQAQALAAWREAVLWNAPTDSARIMANELFKHHNVKDHSLVEAFRARGTPIKDEEIEDVLLRLHTLYTAHLFDKGDAKQAMRDCALFKLNAREVLKLCERATARSTAEALAVQLGKIERDREVLRMPMLREAEYGDLSRWRNELLAAN